MDVIYPRCAGLDVHKQTVVGCVRIAEGGPPMHQVRTFETTTSGLLSLADWLESVGVQHVAMKASGVYWKPVWQVLGTEWHDLGAAHFDRADAAKTANRLIR